MQVIVITGIYDITYSIDLFYNTMYIQCIYINIMVTKIKKWGNSLAIRVPKTYAKERNIREGTPVNFSIEPIISTKKKTRKYNLDDLLDKISDENLHGEISVGPRVGNELL